MLRIIRALCVLAVLLFSGLVSSGEIIYRETFGRPPASSANVNVTNFSWREFINNGTPLNTVANGVNPGDLGKPTDVANVNAGPNIDGTFGAYAYGWHYHDQNPRCLSFTPEFSINPADYVAGSIVFSWYQGNVSITHTFQVIVRVGGVWYASAQTFPNIAGVANAAAFNGGAELKSLTFNPAASNWRVLNFNGDYNHVTQATTSSSLGNLSVGAAPIADLAGTITAFGLYSDQNGASGNRRFDTFTIEAAINNIVLTGTNIWTAAINSDWDLSTLNWATVDAMPTNYLEGSLAIFNDTAVSGDVNLTMSVTPGIVTISNNSVPYNFIGSGAISGVGRLIKDGTGTLLFDNSGSNDFTGGISISNGIVQIGNYDQNGNLPLGSVVNNGRLDFVRLDSFTVPSTISGGGSLRKDGPGILTLSGGNSFTGLVTVLLGTLKAGNPSAFGSTIGETIVTDGATLDVNHFNLGLERVVVSGPGVDGAGAIVDDSGNAAFVSPNLAYVTLAGDTYFGGTGRWDLRSNPSTSLNAALSTAGGAFTLTKVGTNQVSLVGVTVDPALGDIDIQQGMLSFETVTTSMGDSSRTLTVHPGASLAFYNSSALWNKIFNISGDGANASVTNMSGSNTMTGPITLTGDCVFGVGGTALVCNGAVGGSGRLIKHGTGSLTLSTGDDYAAGTTVSNGLLYVNGSLIGTGDVLIFGGTLAGVGQIAGATSIGPNGTIAPGNPAVPISPLEITANVTLAGTNQMDVAKSGGIITSDRLVVGQTLSFGGTLQLSSTGEPLVAGDTIKLYDFAIATGAFAKILPARPGIGLVWNTNQLTIDGTLTVASGGSPLTWTGLPNGNWEIGGSMNWIANGLATNYTDGDSVRFDDSAAGTTAVTFMTTLSPASVTVSNSAANYVLLGAGRITGNTVFTKQQSGTLVVANSGSNDFTGEVTISGGTLQVGDGKTSGNLPSTVAITNHGALIFKRSDNITVTNFVTGTGSIVQDGSGTTTLSAANSHGGGLAVSNGAVRLLNPAAAGTGVIGVASNGTVVAGAAHPNSLSLSGGTLGAVTGLASLPGSEVRAEAGTTSSIFIADPQNLIVNSEVNFTGTLRGSGNIIVVAGSSNAVPDTGVGFRLRGTSASDFSGSITFSNNVKGELQTSVAGPFSPAGTGKIVMVGGLFTGGGGQNAPISGGYSELNVRNNATGNTLFGNNVEIVGSGFTTLNALGNAAVGAVSAMGNLKIGNGQELGIYLASGNAHVIGFSNVTLTGGSATFSPKTPNFGASTAVGSDLSLGDISEQSAGSGIIMAGLRTLTLTGSNSYSGNTLVSSGTLALSGTGSITNSPIITISSGATLTATGRVDGTLSLSSGQTLQGNGTVQGVLSAGTGSTVSPGTSIGLLTVSGPVNLSGTTRMEVNNTTGTNDVLRSSTSITYGGTLSIVNVGAAFSAGNNFKLFDAPSYANAFTITPSSPGDGLVWDTSMLNSSGTLKVAVVPRPGIQSATLSGSDFVVEGTNGAPNQSYVVLSSTNVALPLIDWTPIWTNAFDANGKFSFTNAVDPNAAALFFLLRFP